ncbi:MAG: FAD-dependent thymidylate synthase, partial [Simkaniaceae bacterium]|nr:FAD-dependent thymidylate synthase [Simkaniaceae bacterium]
MLQNYEEFTEVQVKLLEKFVTNTTGSVFALRNLPEVIKGALFSRYSRSSLGLRSLLLKEFILNEETLFSNIAGESQKGDEEQLVAIKKAQNFYDRILDGYGDDSIGELGGAHLAVENVSMIGAKVLEDARIGGSPLEKSTRYIYFDQKVNGEYLYYREPILMTSAFREAYIEMCDHLFDTYSRLIPQLTEMMEKDFPKEHDVSKVAYTAALRAKVLDCLRGLLPASSLTNVGIFGNGRFFETLIQKLNSHNLSEMQDIGRDSFQELSKVIPSFIRRAEVSHKHQKATTDYLDKMNGELQLLQQQFSPAVKKMEGGSVKLVAYDHEAPIKVAAGLLFSGSHAGLKELQEHCHQLSKEELGRILDAACSFRENRRHKSPRALEQAFFTFEIVADFGIYRDLQRHRMLTQERQHLSCDYGFYIPREILGTELEGEYREAMTRAREVYDLIAEELPEEAQYVVPMAYNMHWYFHVNLRALQWICELRSSPAGHP